MYKPAVERPGSNSNTTSGSKKSAGKVIKDDKKKPVVACMGCRKKKIKCSGDRPCCSNCLRLSIPCEYPLIKNRGSRYEYRDMMQKRIDNLKKYYSDSALLEHAPEPNNGGSSEESVDSIMSNISPYNSNKNNGARVAASDSFENNVLPPMEVIEHLAELYFKHVHGQTYAFLHKPTFMERLRQNKVSNGLILALCGLTARYSKHPSVANSEPFRAGEEFVHRARKVILTEVFDDKPTLETVQALICLVQNQFFRSQGGKTMIIVSVATRVAANLSLHLNIYDPNSTWIEQETQRRTFWSLIVMDRLAHSSPNWTVQFDVGNFELLPLPCSDLAFLNNQPTETPTLPGLQDSELKGNIGLFAYHIQAVMLWCDVNKYAMGKDIEEPWQSSSQFMTLRQRIEEFTANLPAKYQYSQKRLAELHAKNRAGQFIHLHAAIHLSVCVLNRSICRNHNHLQFIKSASQAAIDAANAMSDMVNDMLHADDRITVAPFVGFAVFTISAVHVTNSFSSSAILADQAKAHLATNLKLLVELRELWYAVGQWCNILKERYAKRSSEWSSTNAEDPGSPPHPYLPEELMQNNPGDTTMQDKVNSPVQPAPLPPAVAASPQREQQTVPVTTENGWDGLQRRGEQELTKEWNNLSFNTVEDPNPFVDMFLGIDEESSRAIVDQFSTEWFTDLQSLME